MSSTQLDHSRGKATAAACRQPALGCGYHVCVGREMATPTIIGRDDERSRLAAAAGDAARGRGSLWLLTGEPGIGKSRLAEEAERSAREAGFVCAWGRCWEQGGAPAYWPWAQIVRTLRRTLPDADIHARTLRVVESLLPEAGVDPQTVASPEGRFELFDAFASWLGALAQARPLWICIEDMHGADPASLALLESLVSTVRTAPFMLIGTVRDTTIEAGSMRTAYRRITRQAQAIALPRLDREGTRRLLADAFDPDRDDVVAAAVDATGGLPLFVVELARLARTAAPGADALALVPASVQGALRHRLDAVSEDGLAVLRRAALVGMDVARDLLADGLGPARVDAAIAEGVSASLVRSLAPRSWRLSHALLRDALTEDLDARQVEEAHAEIAGWMAERGESDAARAHHLYRAGESHLEAAMEAGLAATRDCLARFAFEDAQAHLEDAQDALRPRGSEELRARIGVLSGLAAVGLGRVEEGLASCVEAAELARAVGAAEIMAEAALAYGSVFRFANVDPELIGLLERALAALPEVDSAMRAQLLARLAAARQPDPKVERPIALALEAIEIAERVGDEPALAATLRSGCSALVDLAHPGERRRLDQRHLDLAVRRGLPADEQHARARLAFDCVELGDFPAANAHIDALLRLLRSRDDPRVRWRVPALEVLRNLWRGTLDGVRAGIAQVRRLGEAVDDGNAVLCSDHQLGRLLELTGADEETEALADAFGRMFAGSRPGERLSRLKRAHFFLELGRPEEGVAALDRDDARLLLQSRDRTALLPLACWAEAARDEQLGARLLEQLRGEPDLFVTDGVLGLVWRAPIALALARASQATGATQDALDWSRRAAVAADLAGGASVCAEAHALAAHYARGVADEAVAEHHTSEARSRARTHGLHGVLRRLGEPEGRESPAPTDVRADVPAFIREGDVWCIRWRGREARLKSTKGLAVLAALVGRPGEEVHVLDLVDERPSQGVDTGDAGELIDPQARAEYRARREGLIQRIDEAAAANDLGRAQALRHELEFVEAELLRATGRGGRLRRAPAAEERARQAVRKQVATALARVREVHPALARYLERAIRTGRVCSFLP